MYHSKTYPKRRIISIIGIVILIVIGVLIALNNYRIASHFNISLSKYCIYEPRGITVDSSGNIYVLGSSKPYGEEDYDVLLLKYNSSGNLLWNRTWDSSELDSGKDIISDSIGNIYITGRNETELILLKYNSSGYLQWSKTWNNSSSNDYADRIAMDNLGNIYIMGWSRTCYPLIDIILLKYNSNGNLQWEKKLSDPNNPLRGEGIATDGLGDIYIVGTNSSSPRKNFILKYNSLGDLLWKRIWANIRSRAIETDSSGNIYVTGYTTDSQSFILKYNTTGEL
ncbi:MAG: SBBP repeat-containing protein, partial [Candidatus Thorarchaeota archaeon]